MDLVLTRKQIEVLNLIQPGDANEILYGGAAGGGKSWLLRALAIIWAIQVPGAQIFLFRRKVKDLVATHMRGPSSFPVLLKEYVDDKLCKINLSNNYIEFENNSIISLNHCQHDSDLNNFLSAEIHILLIDESTTFAEKMIRFLRGRLRTGSLQVPEEFIASIPFIVYGSNPRGESHVYFKTKFVDAGIPGIPFQAAPEEGGMRRCFVPSLLSDNPHIEKEYSDRLRGLGDPDVVEAYLSGDWSIVEGAALPSLKREHHVVLAGECCESWPVYRGYDYGYSAPYSVLYYQVATGESSTGFNPPKGSIIFHSELYGANERGEGLKEEVPITAKRMKLHEAVHYGRVKPGPADAAIFSKEQGPAIHDSFLASGIEFEPSDKSPGSRAIGLEEVRKLLFNAIIYRLEKPGIYMTELCPFLFSHLTSLQLDEKKVDDVDTNGVDHDYDVVRYVVLHRSLEILQVGVTGT